MDDYKKEQLKRIISEELTRQEKLIIVLYYYEEMTMREIGAVLNMPAAEVSQEHSSLIQRIKFAL
jgi:RNA polymerase sigma factor for flagellar operon FliA